MFLTYHLSPIFSQFSNQSYLVNYLAIFKAVKEIYKVYFLIFIFTGIGKYKIRIIDFGSITNLNFLLFGQYIINITCQ